MEITLVSFEVSQNMALHLFCILADVSKSDR
jgi:hypothetical protein